MTSLRNALLFLVVILTLSFTISNEVLRTYEKSNISKGNLAPDFLFEDSNHKSYSLNDLKGKYIYINFWTTWSKPSLKELPHLQNLTDTFEDKITFVNLSIDYQKDIDVWKNYIKNNNLKGIQLISDKDWNSDFIKTFDVIKIPRAILIDKEGKIIDPIAPKPSSKEIVELLESLE